MKKATKYSNSPGKEYFENAAKQIPWTVNINHVTFEGKTREERYISVPSSQWDEAMDNIMVSHLVKQHGFVLQDCIPYEVNKPFDPEIRLRNARPLTKEEAEDEFKVGRRFRLVSDGTRFEITESGANGITVKYIDGQKLPFKSTRDIIKRNLSLGVWKQI